MKVPFQHAAADPMFANQANLAQSHLSDLRKSNATFLANIREDQATGSTPRKRTWNVPAAWEATAPRDALISKYRQMHADNDNYAPSYRIAPPRMENLGGDDGIDEVHDASLTSPVTPTTPFDQSEHQVAPPNAESVTADRDVIASGSTESSSAVTLNQQLHADPLAPTLSQETLPSPTEPSISATPVELAKPLPITEPTQATVNPLKMSRTKSALNRSTARVNRGEDKENVGGESNIPQRRVRRNI
jgi:hypothetical protein